LAEKQKNYAEEISCLFHPQLNNFQELVDLSDYFFLSPPEQEKNGSFFPELEELLSKIIVWNEESIRKVLQSLEKKMLPLARSKLTGRKSGPELVKVIYLLGKEKTLERLKK
jgi:nondiscriminating glutamyl-tRNA synthetase